MTIRDMGLLWVSWWLLLWVYVIPTWSLILSLPCRKNNTKNLNNLRFSPGIYQHSRVSNWQPRLMGNELEVLGQGLALEGLQRAAADGEDRQTHAQLLEVMAQTGSGRGQELSTIVGAGRDAATPSPEHSEVGDRGREGERVSAEDGHLGGKGSETCVGALEVCRR